MEWIVAIAIVVVGIACLPMLLRGSRKPRRKGTAGGISMMIGLAFMTIFDPGKAQAVEEIRQKKDLGDADQGESGEGKD